MVFPPLESSMRLPEVMTFPRSWPPQPPRMTVRAAPPAASPKPPVQSRLLTPYLPQVKSDIQGRRGVGQGPHRDPVHSRGGHLPQLVRADPARGLEGRAGIRAPASLPGGGGHVPAGHVVEEDDVRAGP